ncbi:MAG: hypothetical protein AAFO75_00490 [Pseudomonadota bacterium]
MLGYLILIIIQIIVSVFGMQQLMGYIPSVIDGLPLLLLKGAIYGALVWAIAVLCSFVLKGVRTPGGGTAASAIVGGLIGAGVVIALDIFNIRLPIDLNKEFILIAGAILGYLSRR